MLGHRSINTARLAFAGLLVLCGALAACDDGTLPSDTTTSGTTNTNSTGTTPVTGGAGGEGAGGAGAAGGAAGSGGSGGAPDCYMNPMTHVEIINACTDAEQIDKMPVLPLLNPDGSLPDLP